MTNVLIVYASQYGSTKKMAKTIALGAKEEGAEVTLKMAPETTTEDLIKADGIIFGSPVHMGSMDWQMKKFIDEVCSKLWMENKLNGKVGAVFATGSGFGNAGGGCELTMLSMLNNLVELGLLFIPLPKNTPGYADAGLQWGPYGRSMGPNMEQTGLTDEQLEAARHHGKHVARAAKLIKGQPLFS